MSNAGELIREERKKRGWSQATLAERADVSVDWVRGVEQGRIERPNMEQLVRTSRALGISSSVFGIEPSEAGPVEYLLPDQVADLNASFLTLKKMTPKRLEDARRFLEVFAAMDDDEFQNSK